MRRGRRLCVAVLAGVFACGVAYNLSLVGRMAQLRAPPTHPQTLTHAAVRGVTPRNDASVRRASPSPSPPSPPPPPSPPAGEPTGCAATEYGVEYWGEVVGEWGHARLTPVRLRTVVCSVKPAVAPPATHPSTPPTQTAGECCDKCREHTMLVRGGKTLAPYAWFTVSFTDLELSWTAPGRKSLSCCTDRHPLVNSEGCWCVPRSSPRG
jgi:hypothetical protein